jgi:hypothetical protein
MPIRDKMVILKSETRKLISRGIDYLKSDEEALVVGWFDIAKLLFFTMFLFITLGPLMDAGWIYIHHAPANFYNDTDMKAVDDLYGVYKWIPIVALSIGLVYIINYSNLKKGE